MTHHPRVRTAALVLVVGVIGAAAAYHELPLRGAANANTGSPRADTSAAALCGPSRRANGPARRPLANVSVACADPPWHRHPSAPVGMVVYPRLCQQRAAIVNHDAAALPGNLSSPCTE